MQDIDELFAALGRSKFRSRFRLGNKELSYLNQKGMETIIGHARDFVRTRLADANPTNDGKQTPMRNHPVFIAQHATGTCCRKCLAKWHKIPTGKPLTDEQIDYLVEVIRRWLAGASCRERTSKKNSDKKFLLSEYRSLYYCHRRIYEGER